MPKKKESAGERMVRRLGENPELLELYAAGGEVLEERGIKGLNLGRQDEQWLLLDVQRRRHPEATGAPPIIV